MGKRESDTFRRSEAVLAIQNHAVTAIEQKNRGARALIFALMDHQVGIIELKGNACAIAANGIEERTANVHVQCVAEFIRLRRAAGFDAGGQVASIVPAKTAFAERCEQILQGFETEEIESFVGDLESRFCVRLRLPYLSPGSLRGWRSNLCGLVRLRDVAFPL